jgi:hypothetical protein
MFLTSETRFNNKAIKKPKQSYIGKKRREGRKISLGFIVVVD